MLTGSTAVWLERGLVSKRKCTVQHGADSLRGWWKHNYPDPGWGSVHIWRIYCKPPKNSVQVLAYTSLLHHLKQLLLINICTLIWIFLKNTTLLSNTFRNNGPSKVLRFVIRKWYDRWRDVLKAYLLKNTNKTLSFCCHYIAFLRLLTRYYATSSGQTAMALSVFQFC